MGVAVALGVLETDVKGIQESLAGCGQVPGYIFIVVFVDRHSSGRVRRRDEADTLLHTLLHTRVPRGLPHLVSDRDQFVARSRLDRYLADPHLSPSNTLGKAATLSSTRSASCTSPPGRHFPVLTCIAESPAFFAPTTSALASSPTMATS